MNDESPMQEVGSQIRDIVSQVAALSKVRSTKSAGKYGYGNAFWGRDRFTLLRCRDLRRN